MIIQHLLYDLDGTLIDSAPSVLDCLAKTLESEDIHPCLPLDYQIVGPPLTEMLIRLTGIEDEDRLNKLSSIFKQYYDLEGYKKSRPYPDVDNVLRKCHQAGIKQYIVTNKRIVPTRAIITHLGWDTYFSGIYSFDAFDKPNLSKAEVIKLVLTRHSIPVNNSIYVGDRSEDEEAACDCGLAFAAAGWGYGNWKNSKMRVLVQVKELGLLIGMD